MDSVAANLEAAKAGSFEKSRKALAGELFDMAIMLHSIWPLQLSVY